MSLSTAESESPLHSEQQVSQQELDSTLTFKSTVDGGLDGKDLHKIASVPATRRFGAVVKLTMNSLVESIWSNFASAYGVLDDTRRFILMMSSSKRMDHRR